MKRGAKIIGLLLLLWIIYRPVTHFFCLPGAVRSSWVEPLATAGTGYRHQDELFTGGEEARKVYDNAEPVFKASDQKRRLFATLNAGKGSMGLFRRYSTVEGDPIFEWLLVQDGKLTYVRDSSRDDGARPWAIHVSTPLDFKLGFMQHSKFIEGEPSPTDSPVIVFRLKVPNRLVSRQMDEHYFY
ncbi:MAG: hypothetical protein QOD99_2923 [Chthoniobacter sp.]|jgi:hypothetical protein|nr:hypothetical protein [Chthoniobacter sp.]